MSHALAYLFICFPHEHALLVFIVDGLCAHIDYWLSSEKKLLRLSTYPTFVFALYKMCVSILFYWNMIFSTLRLSFKYQVVFLPTFA